jgi:acetyl-CoA carboxylase carboxyltransferase component
VFLVDVPGFMVGRDAEAAATLREGMRAVYVGLQASVPMYTVVIRKCYGMAGMGATDKNGLDLKIAWPSAEWGSLPIEGGVAAAFRRDIAERRRSRRRASSEIEEAAARRCASPFRTAEAFGVEDIIDPRQTRPYLCRFIDGRAGARLRHDAGAKSKIWRTPLRPNAIP